MKRNRIRFYAQTGAVCVLAIVGLLAICGEPAEDADFITTVLLQIAVWAASWLTAFVLYHKWDIGRKMELIDKLYRRAAL